MTQTIEKLSGTTQHGIHCDSVIHGFDGDTVLEGVTLSVNPGEILAIIGPSGTGKTTLLRILGMFHQPDHGTVRIGPTDVWSLSEQERLTSRRRTAMVFQSANLFDASVYRNVSYGLRVRDGWTERIRMNMPLLANHHHADKVSDTLGIVGLEGAEDRMISSLSGGEAQRVAFARALATGSEYLLLDEPTSELDPRNTAVIEEAVRTARTGAWCRDSNPRHASGRTSGGPCWRIVGRGNYRNRPGRNCLFEPG